MSMLHKNKTRTGPPAALDIGNTMISCFIATGGVGEDGLRVDGIGHHRSEGIKNGAVTDMEAAERAIRAAVDAAERMAGTVIDTVVVNVSGGQPRSNQVKVEVAVDGHRVGEADMQRIQESLSAGGVEPGRQLVHHLPISYSIDGAPGIHDPHDMAADRLGVTIHQVKAQTNVLRNLQTVVQRCHLDVEDWVVTPYASALGCLVEDAMELGVTCIDMGGGMTSIAVFQHGNFVHMGIVPVGGMHVTNDIAQGLSTPLTHAERLKTLYGSALMGAADKHETLKIPQIGGEGDDPTTEVPRAMLNEIIQPRIEETLELVRNHLDASGLTRGAGRMVVLTGGASQLDGVVETATLVLNKQIRICGPHGLRGLAEASRGPAYSTCAGLLRHAALRRENSSAHMAVQRNHGAWGRLGQWLHQNF